MGVDNPNRQYEVAITMDGAINANFIKVDSLSAISAQPWHGYSGYAAGRKHHRRYNQNSRCCKQAGNV